MPKYEYYSIFSFHRLRFFPNFIETPEADEMYGILFHELPWKQKNDIKNGVEYPQPRLTAWCGDVPYSYSGVTHQPDTKVHTHIYTYI